MEVGTRVVTADLEWGTIVDVSPGAGDLCLYDVKLDRGPVSQWDVSRIVTRHPFGDEDPRSSSTLGAIDREADELLQRGLDVAEIRETIYARHPAVDRSTVCERIAAAMLTATAPAPRAREDVSFDIDIDAGL